MTISDANEPFASGLKNIIKQKKYKNIQVAKKAGYTAQQLSDMLNGRRLIKPCDLLRLSVAVEASFDEICRCGKEGD